MHWIQYYIIAKGFPNICTSLKLFTKSKNAVLDAVNSIVKYISVPMQMYENMRVLETHFTYNTYDY